MANEKPQTHDKHPPEWDADLNPDHMAGQNIGTRAPGSDPRVRTARDVKELAAMLEGFTDSELREIPLVPDGDRLQAGATYLDLAVPGSQPFQATASMVALRGSWLVKHGDVPYAYWNRLAGRRGVERTEGAPARR